MANGFASFRNYDTREDFDLDKVNFPFLDGAFPRRAFCGVYISHIIRFARVCNHVTDGNARKKNSKFHRRHYELSSKLHVSYKMLLRESLLEPEFYVDFVYSFNKHD